MRRTADGFHSGLTLVELLVSCMILGLSLISFSLLYLAGHSSHIRAQSLLLATERAQYELEKAHRFGYAALAEGPTQAMFPTAASGGEYTWLTSKVGAAFPVPVLRDGRGMVTWQPYRTTGGISCPSLLRVEVTVIWTISSYNYGHIKLISLVAKT